MDTLRDFQIPTPAEIRLRQAIEQAGAPGMLRLFAATCAGIAAPAGPATAALLAAALAAEDDPECARRVREAYGGTACAASVVGLKRHIPSAAGTLSAYAAAGEDVKSAANQAALYARMAAVWHGADRDRVTEEQIQTLWTFCDDAGG